MDVELPNEQRQHLSGIGKRLINQLQTKQITVADFMRECAYWALRYGFDELAPKPDPVKPEKVFEYERLPFEKRAKLDMRFFDDYPEIMRYFEERRAVAAHNRGVVEWLKEIDQYLPVDDAAARGKIATRLNEFLVKDDGPEVERAGEYFGATRVV